MDKLSQILWRERDLLDTLLYRLEQEQLLLASGRSRWLMRAAQEVNDVLETIRETEILRSMAADEAAATLGLESNPSLRALAEAVDEPWHSILMDHHDAFTLATREIVSLADANRELITVAYRSARETLLSLGGSSSEGQQGYGADGTAVSAALRAPAGRLEPVTMTGTFSSFNTALSALTYNRVAMDVANGNIANSSTDGYVRRRLVGEAVGAPAQPAMWSRYPSTAGDGVAVSSIDRMTDVLLEARVRREHASQSYLDIRQSTLERVEAGIGEPSDTGVSAAIAGFRSSWSDLANNPGSDAARSAVLGAATTLADALAVQSRNIDSESSDLRQKALSDVTEINTVASDLAQVNKSIAVANLNGTDAGTLLDQRDQLAQRLSELSGAKATLRADGGFDVTLDGVALVTGQDAGVLSVASGIDASGASDGNPITYAITDSGGSTTLSGALTGRPRRGDRPADHDAPGVHRGAGHDRAEARRRGQRRARRRLRRERQRGWDVLHLRPDPPGRLAGRRDHGPRPGRRLLPRRCAQPGQPERRGAGLGDRRGRRLPAARQRLRHRGRLGEAVGGQPAGPDQRRSTTPARQLAGVNLDEETVNLMQAQRGYEAASRVMTTVDSVLDTLINRTGLVR